ncbi:protein kinase [Rhodococcus sp. WMMA185]|uniref:serine/threonine-protein kinase n=1 Tax=Rhodococcus sp. WMMA185 TaxID=679318 RepID=UPI0008783E86|nr:serine/threonine-protein kinase [Rhodococcus sp. WMMA185]AOW93668.1 protein kinase [Rhodococcus sp. WMMA185]
MQFGARFGRYRLDLPMSADANGEVWAAFDTVTNQHVTVRALPAETTENDEYRDRFERVAGIAANIHHPYVLPVHDFGQIGDRLFLATPHIQGTSLHTMLQSTGAMEVPRAVDIIEQLASALEAVHAAGLAEQVVTSSNVHMQENGLICLTDVGLPASPGRPSGVYGLASVLYECLTGMPFQPSGGNELPTHPSSVMPTVPAGMDAVIARGTAVDPARRYPSESELAAAARGVVAPAPSVPEPSPSIPPVNWRRRAMVAGLSVVAIIAVAIVGGIAIGSRPSPDATVPAASPTSEQASSPTVTTPPPATTHPTQAEQAAPEQAPQQAQTQIAETAPPQQAPQPAPAPAPAPAPQVLPCYDGYQHTPPPDGPCLSIGSSPEPAQVPAAPAPQVLPCYDGYQHTPPPDGPCLPIGSSPEPAQVPAAPAPQVLPCYDGYQHTPPPDGPCRRIP